MDMNQLINSFVDAFATQIADRVLLVVMEDIDTKIQQAADAVVTDEIQDKVQKFLERYDFSELINEAIDNEDIEGKVEKAIDEYDLDDKVKDIVNELSFSITVR